MRRISAKEDASIAELVRNEPATEPILLRDDLVVEIRADAENGADRAIAIDALEIGFIIAQVIVDEKGLAPVDRIDAADDCLFVGDVSHDVLFPRVAAVIHHGGAGTTAAAARAGIPQVIAPMFGDQFYWASRIVALGVGTEISHATMAEESLTDAVQQVFDPAVVLRARRLAGQVSWDGAEIAARRLDAEYGSQAHS